MTAGRGIVLVLLVCTACVHRGRIVETACTNRVLEEAVGPEGGTKAVVFERRCTAPLGFTTQVALTGADMRLSDRPGNVFVASNGGRVPRGRSFVTVSWAGPRKLVVEFERGTAVYRLERRVAGVEVVYVARDADGHAAAPQDAPQPRRAK